MLNRVSQHSEVNMMTSQNLAICIGPNILRRFNENPLQALQDSSGITHVTRVLIAEYNKVFERSAEAQRNGAAVAATSLEQAVANLEARFHAQMRVLEASNRHSIREDMDAVNANNRRRGRAFKGVGSFLDTSSQNRPGDQ
jgi:hypothetical protein